MLGDFNAKIGKENFIKSVAGKHTLHAVTSENGKRLGQFAARHNMLIKSSCYEHKRIHKGTWLCPGTNKVNQIDHVVINKRHGSSIRDVKSCRGPHCDSDHFLVKVSLGERLSNALKNQGRRKKRWNTEKLKNEEEFSLYHQRIEEKLEQADGPQEVERDRTQSVQTEWNKIKKCKYRSGERNDRGEDTKKKRRMV